jgi:hypothetical protein
VHRVASLAKRWLLGTHQGSVAEAHLPAYLDEFVFRFNRRRSASRGMVFYRVLELAAGHDPVRFQDLLAGKKPHPAPVARGWGHPPSLDRPAANRPWRTGELQLQLPIPLRLSEYPKCPYSSESPLEARVQERASGSFLARDRRDLLALAGGEGDRRHHIVRRFREHHRGRLLVGGQVKCPPGLVEARLPGQDDLPLQTGGQTACLA